jgi:hypothetical protein
MKSNFKKLLVATITVMTMGYSAYADKNVKIEIKEMPQRAQEFLTTFFGEMPVDSISTDDARSEYEVSFTGSIDVEFDRNGNWTKVERDMQKWQISMARFRENWQRQAPQRPNTQEADKVSKKDRKDKRNKKEQNAQNQRPQGQWGQGQPGQRPQGQWGQGQPGQRPQGQWGQGQPGQRPKMFTMESLLNENIQNYIKSNYQFAMITIIERFSNGYMITIATGRDTSDSLIFALDGRFIQKAQQ